jgi:hypothetical protein
LTAMHGENVTITIPTGTVIQPGDYLVIQPGRQWLDDEGEVIALNDSTGSLIDRSMNATDRSDDGRSWQRFPNGQDTDSDADWVFGVATKDQTNGGEPVPTSSPGFGFMVIPIVAGIGMAGCGVAAVASVSGQPRVFAYAGYYYCGKHRVPLYSVNGWSWCPVERRYLTRLCRSCSNAMRQSDRFCDRCGRPVY